MKNLGRQPIEDGLERIARLEERVKALERQVSCFIEEKEFRPVARICYGFIGIILATVATALIKLVLK